MSALKRLVVFLLTVEARIVLWRYKPRIIAITGNIGKTTTKDAIYAALSPHLHIRKSEKSLNSDFGVPLTILGCESGWRNPLKWVVNIVKGLGLILIAQPYPKWLVLEIGADRPGDIRSIAKWLRPDIAVLTGVPEVPVHVEFFDSPEQLAREKLSVAEYLRPGGKLIINWDSERMRTARIEYRGASVTYGLTPEADLYASDEAIRYEGGKPVGLDFRVYYSGSSLPVSIAGALGLPRVYAAVAALAVAQSAGVDLVSAAAALHGWPAPPGRLRLIEGRNGSTIIDDTYNSSPAAAHAALETLAGVQTSGRKIAMLGDMMELGKYSAEAHRKIGAAAATVADLLVTVGIRSRASAEAALDAGMEDDCIRQYEQTESARAGKELALELKPGDVVLVKGSQSMRMERAVFDLMAHPEQAAELLVRQDEEWKVR